jgi:Sensors of blue-light using FAD.
MVITLLYCSRSRMPTRGPPMGDLAAQCRRNNPRLGVTGALVADEGAFFQVLEGEADVVDSLFAVIAADPRHRDVRRLVRAPLAARRFGRWSMKLIDGDRYAHLARVFRYERLAAAERSELEKRVALLERL